MSCCFIKFDLILFFLVIIFAISSWIDINGIWVLMPIFVRNSPESWNLSSYLVVAIQIANIGPLLYLILKILFPKKLKEWPVIILIILIGLISCILLIFFWKKKTIWHVFNEPRSSGLIFLTLVLAFVDCTSSVLYFPYISSFPVVYMTALFIGEGLSGLIPAILGLAQLTEPDQYVTENKTLTWGNFSMETKIIRQNPRFSVEVFFGLMAILLILSFISFLLVHFLPRFKKIRKVKGQEEENNNEEENEENGETNPWKENWTKKQYLKGIGMLIMTTWLNLLTNSFLPALQTYSALSYGNLVYNLHVKLSVLINPIACFISLFYSVSDWRSLLGLTVSGTIPAAYQIALARMSPNPPGKNENVGMVFCVLTQLIMVGIFSYTKVCLATTISTWKGKRWMMFYGAAVQLGSLIGALVSFGLINFTELFKMGF